MPVPVLKTVDYRYLKADQIAVANKFIALVKARADVPIQNKRKVSECVLCTVGAEASWKPTAGGDALNPNSSGWFQQSPDWGSLKVRQDMSGSLGLFLHGNAAHSIKGLLDFDYMKAKTQNVCQDVQKSEWTGTDNRWGNYGAYPRGYNFQVWLGVTQKLLDGSTWSNAPTPFPFMSNEYFGDINGPNESHGGDPRFDSTATIMRIMQIQRLVGVTPVDGQYQASTIKAVLAWQKAHHIPGVSPSGKVGPLTWKAMGL